MPGTWPREGGPVAEINGPRQAAVLGSPVRHSLSAVLHRAADQPRGLADWSYTAITTAEAALPSLLTWLRSEPTWAGLSLTMPLKTVAVGLVDRLDETAALVGAVNTV